MDSITTVRRYSVKDVDWFIDVLRVDGEMAEQALAGIEKLAFALHHYEFMTDAEIEWEIHKHVDAKQL